MTLDLDALIPTGEQAQILQARIDRAAREAFDWQTTATTAASEGDTDRAAQAAAALATLTSTIESLQSQLAALDDESS